MNLSARRILCGLLTLAVAGAPSVSLASSPGSPTVTVQASVVNNCVVNSATLNFGNYDGAIVNASTALTQSAALSLTCTSGDSVTVSADNGQNASQSSGTTRAMSDGSGHFLSYDLYTNSGDTIVWNSSNQLSYTGTGSAGSLSFYGSIPAGQAVPAGSYTDAVTLTATF